MQTALAETSDWPSMAKLLAALENGMETQVCVYLVVVVVRVGGFRPRTSSFISASSLSLLRLSTHQEWPLNPKPAQKIKLPSHLFLWKANKPMPPQHALGEVQGLSFHSFFVDNTQDPRPSTEGNNSPLIQRQQPDSIRTSWPLHKSFFI